MKEVISSYTLSQHMSVGHQASCREPVTEKAGGGGRSLSVIEKLNVYLTLKHPAHF